MVQTFEIKKGFTRFLEYELAQNCKYVDYIISCASGHPQQFCVCTIGMGAPISNSITMHWGVIQ